MTELQNVPEAYRVLTVRVGEARFAFYVTGVQEVLRDVAVFPVPLVGGAVAGIMNLRGEVITALDFGALVGVESEGAGGRTVLVRDGGELVGLLVDEVFDVFDIAATEIFSLDNAFEGLKETPICRGFYHRGVLHGLVDLDTVLGRVAAP